MALDAPDQKTLNSLPGCPRSTMHTASKVNALSLMKSLRYTSAQVSLSGKAARLTPHLRQVRDNWRRCYALADSLLIRFDGR